jgi:hypothetical protein
LFAPATASAQSVPTAAKKSAEKTGQTTLTKASVPGKPVDKKPQPAKAVDAKNAKPQDDAKPADKKAEEKKADDAKPADKKPEDKKPEDAKPAEPKADANKDEPSAGTVLVRIDSPAPVVLEQEDEPKSESFKPACDSPCEKRLPTGVRYRVVPKEAGADLRPSKPFYLDTQGDTLRLKVKPATKSDETNGIIVMGASGAVFVAGVVTLIVGFANRTTVQPGIDGSVSDRSYPDTMWVGSALTVGGLVGGIVGTSMYLKSKNSEVVGGVQAPPPAQGRAPSPGRSVGTATGAGGASWEMPRAHTFPILRGSF